jgi:hypothetical protein
MKVVSLVFVKVKMMLFGGLSDRTFADVRQQRGPLRSCTVTSPVGHVVLGPASRAAGGSRNAGRGGISAAAVMLTVPSAMWAIAGPATAAKPRRRPM